ncbi:TolB family protein [Calditrichota bacterium GD2]
MKCFSPLFIAAFLFLTFCSKMATNTDHPVNLEAGQLSLTIDMKKAPAEVAYLKGFLARADHDTIFFDFEISDGLAYATINDVENGEWYLQVDAYDESGNRKYSGSIYVFVEAGKITPVFLNLVKIFGGIDITVSWGGVPQNMMLLMALNASDNWHILLMKEDGSKIFDLIDGRYPMWINDQRDKFMFLRNRDELCEFDLSTHNVKFIASLGVNANFLFYSRPLNRILFDYKYFGDYSYPWQLASVNVDGQDFHTILSDTSKKKYPATPPNSDWIYYHVNHNGRFQIYRIKHDGSQNQPVIAGDFHCEFPSFDRSGQQMVYTKISLDSSYKAVVIHNLSTHQEQEIDVSQLGQPTYPAFSYDGADVIFSVIVGPEHKDRQLFRFNTNTNNLTQITAGREYFWYARPVFW